ncbi:hypothetical protein AY599_00455 [Leptolyngbya valderiana BDU 20041]|nr:DUF3352 domain-containing protein [Geitlerinema sp. CS-897]OAB63044.1 hypothetical protein AY599_00455 [Leptolyngbya valderiana BDU 20041]PPT08686.1 hypothetical protein CKA32_003603 [Geitlerinema sp. FC II]
MTESSKKKGCLGYSIAIAAMVLVATGATAYWILRERSGRHLTPLASAEAIPDEAVMTAYVTLDDRPWGKLQQFGTSEAKAVVRQAIDSWQQEIFEGTQLDFNRDLKPWVGSLAIAVVPDEASGGESSELLTVVGIKDKLQALGFANRVKAQEGTQLEDIDYRGTTISRITEPGGSSYSVAVLGDYLTISDDLDLVKASIDTFRGEPSFAKLPGMAKLLRQGINLDDPLARVYVADLEALQDFARTEWTEQLPITAVQSLVMGVGVTDTGLHGRVMVRLDADRPQLSLESVSGTMARRFPNNTLMLAEGRDLDRSWTQFVDTASATPEGETFVSTVREASSSFGLDIDREVFGVMDGDFGFGLIPSEKGILASLGFGGAIVVETSDRKTAEATMDKLGSILQRNLPLPMSFDSRQANNVTVTEWNVPFFGVKPETVVGYGWLDDRALAIALGGPIVDAIVTPPETPLSQNETFLEIQQQLPENREGYLYVNVLQMLQLVDPRTLQANEIVTPDSLALLNSIRGIGAASSSPNETTAVLDVAVPLVVENP